MEASSCESGGAFVVNEKCLGGDMKRAEIIVLSYSSYE